MKKIIISVAAAAMALSTSAMAIDNVKANGQAKLIYQATDNALLAGDKLFSQGSNAGQVGVVMGLSADLSSNLSGAVEVSAVSTLGLENNLVGGTMATNNGVNAGGRTGEAATDDQFWISQAYLAYTMGKTTAKVGIQELNTPLAFTEKWNVVNNTFQAIVLVNQDIENVTLVGAYVGKGNSLSGAAGNITGGGGQMVNYDGKFESFHGGAYAAGAVAKIGGINAQAWYYDIDDVLNATIAADAYWLEVDTKVAGIFLGAQYAGTETEGAGAATSNSINAFAVKVAADVAGVHVYGAYSQVDDDASAGTALGFANFGTGDKTKLYTGTASIYADGATVANEDTDAWKLGAKTKMAGIAFGASYTNVEYGNNAALANQDGQAWDAFVASKVGPVGVKAIYTNYTRDTNAGVKTFDRDTLRLIATAKF
jgi:hypothetical protein